MNTNKPQNPQAFPRTFEGVTPNGDTTYLEGMEGMTLRDYFAAKAMMGFNAIQEVYEGVTHEVVAKMAYEQADAMLAEREKVAE